MIRPAPTRLRARAEAPPAAAPARPALVEVAPNRLVQLDLQVEVPEVVLCDVVPIDGQPGAFRLVPRSFERLVAVTPELLDRIGLAGGINILKRLIRSNFVDGARVSPQRYTVNLASYFRHLKRCAEDPAMWDDPKVRAEYMSAYF